MANESRVGLLEYTICNGSLEREYTMWNGTLEREYTEYAGSFDQNCRLYTFIIDVLIIGTLIVVGLIGNILTFAVFWRGNFKTSTSFLFMCLSLSDSVVLLTAFPSLSMWSFVEYTGYIHGFSKIHKYISIFVFPLHLASHMTSMWLTVLISINRYVIVCLPLRASQWCTSSKVKTQLAVVLFFSILYSSVDLATMIFLGSRDLIHIPVLYPTLDIILPISILTLLNIRLIIGLNDHRRMQNQNQSSQNKDSTTFVLIIIVVVLIVCHVPRLVNIVCWIVKSYINWYRNCSLIYLDSISNMLVVLNSAVNFIIYTILNKAFRQVLIQQVCKRPAPQHAAQHAAQQAVIAHEIADIEMAGAGATATPRASTGVTVRPIASVGAIVTPIANTDVTVKPIASTGATVTPIASTGATVMPIASTDATVTPIASTGATVTPIASTGATVTPIASTGATVTPIASTGATVTQIASTGSSVPPIASTRATVTPIARAPARR